MRKGKPNIRSLPSRRSLSADSWESEGFLPLSKKPRNSNLKARGTRFVHCFWDHPSRELRYLSTGCGFRSSDGNISILGTSYVSKDTI
jgi:hypothetical protein